MLHRSDCHCQFSCCFMQICVLQTGFFVGYLTGLLSSDAARHQVAGCIATEILLSTCWCGVFVTVWAESGAINQIRQIRAAVGHCKATICELHTADSWRDALSRCWTSSFAFVARVVVVLVMQSTHLTLQCGVCRLQIWAAWQTLCCPITVNCMLLSCSH